MRKSVAIALLALFLASYVVPLGVRPLTMADEFRYAEIPREMLERGDWIVPRLNGLRYFEKPVLGYWLTAISIWAFGENAFAVRLPAAASAAATVVVVVLLARRFAGGAVPAAVAAAVLLTLGQFNLIGTHAVLDMPLTMFLTAGMALFYCAYVAEARGRKVLYLALLGLAMGGAFLLKGFLAFAVPAVVAIPFLAWERRTAGLVRLAWIPALIVVAVSAPWAILIHLREPGFWRYFFWEEHVRRFLHTDAQHAQPVWYFLPVMLFGAMPWTLVAPAAGAGLRSAGLRDSLTRLAICWVVFPLLLFSASRGKLATYALPCFPPLALLVATGLLRYFAQGKRSAFVTGARVLAGLMAAVALILAVAQLARWKGAPFGKDETWKWAAGVAVLAAWAALAWQAARRRDVLGRILLFGAGLCLFMAIAPFILPGKPLEQRSPAGLLSRNAARISPHGPIFADIHALHAVCWCYKRSDVLLLEEDGELAYGLASDRAKAWFPTEKHVADFLARCTPETCVTVVTDSEDYDPTSSVLPRPQFKDENAGYVFLQYRGGPRQAQAALSLPQGGQGAGSQ